MTRMALIKDVNKVQHRLNLFTLYLNPVAALKGIISVAVKVSFR